MLTHIVLLHEHSHNLWCMLDAGNSQISDIAVWRNELASLKKREEGTGVRTKYLATLFSYHPQFPILCSAIGTLHTVTTLSTLSMSFFSQVPWNQPTFSSRASASLRCFITFLKDADRLLTGKLVRGRWSLFCRSITPFRL